MASEPFRIEMIAMQMRDVEVVGRRERGGIEPVVSGEREPRAEVRGREPRIAQHGSALGLHGEAHMTEERHSHRCHSCQSRPRSRIEHRLPYAWVAVTAEPIVRARLLLVEDEDAIAVPLVEGLEREGFDVTSVRTGG